MLLEECERDHRLLTLTDEQITLNSLSARLLKARKNYNDDTASKESRKLECHLNRAHWQQVCIRFFFLLLPFHNLVFQNGSYTLRNIHFDAHPGDLICIIGPVGAGKVFVFFSSLTFIFIIVCCLEFTFAITLR